MPSQKYPLDRTYFKASTFQEADDHFTYWKQKTLKERLEAAYYLITSAYNLSSTDAYRIDKNYFTSRKHKF